MKVVLLERVTSLGAIGDVVTVKDGYARNFLLPRAKALRATASNLQAFEGRREEIEQRNAENRQDAQRRGDRIDGASYILIRQAGESGQLYGSVSGRDVAEAMEAEGARVQRGQIVLDRPIKTLGVHDVKVQLHAEVEVTVHVNVARSADEAERQAAGEDVIASRFDDERAQDAEAAQDMLSGGAGQAMQDAY